MDTFADFNWKLIGIIGFLSFANSTLVDKLQAIYHENGCGDVKCEVIEIKFPRLHKRSIDPTISISLKIFGHETTINLQPSSDSIVGPNTPVYFASSTLAKIDLKKKYGLFSSNYKLYEDKAKLAAFTFENDSDDFKIESGFLGYDNLIITKIKEDGFGDKYLAKMLPNDTFDEIRNYINVNSSFSNNSNKLIPEEIYPEVLVIVDYKLYSNFQEDTIFRYLFEFWTGVNTYFSTLKDPRYRLSIAGVIIPQDEKVLEFTNPLTVKMEMEQIISYEAAVFSMDSWLAVVKQFIPYSSYDTYILMTFYRDGIFEVTNTAGLSAMNSACSGVHSYNPHGGIIYDKGNFRGILTAAHELGHIFGADHDNSKSSCAFNSIMAEVEFPTSIIWSQCSIRYFQDALQKQDFSCMYNKPNLKDADPTENPVQDLNRSVPDSEVSVITPDMFNLDKLVVISHEKNFIRVRQIDRDVDHEEDLGHDDLNVSIPGRTSLIFDPRMIHPTKMIIINYIRQKLHINTNAS